MITALLPTHDIRADYFKLETSQGPPVGMTSLPHLFVHILKYNFLYFVGQCDSTYFLSQIG